MIETIEQNDVALITRPVHALWAWNIAEKLNYIQNIEVPQLHSSIFQTNFPFLLSATLSDQYQFINYRPTI